MPSSRFQNGLLNWYRSVSLVPELKSRKFDFGWTDANIPDQKKKVFMVTGGNNGIGFATVTALAKKRVHLILARRDLEKGNAALAKIKARQSDAESYCRAA
jgi:short chain dehydrogenase